MKKYKIDYEHGIAEFFTFEENEEKAINEFYVAASQCFGIRKSIGKTEIISVEESDLPRWVNKDNVTHGLFYNGAQILFNSNNIDKEGNWEKIKSEWD